MSNSRSKVDREAGVARSLCRALGPDWKFVASREPPHPDCLIEGPRGEVAVELIGYRQRGEVNNLWERDDQFRMHLEDQLGRDAKMAGVAVQFQYRNWKGGGYARIPRRSHYAAICAEAASLIRHAQSLGDESAEFSFVEMARNDLRLGGESKERSQWITGRYPVLGEWFAAVDVRFYPSVSITRASTGFHTMWVGLDEEELVRAIGAHAQSVDRYRSSTSAPIWLLVYSGGYPVSTSFPSLQAARAIELAASAANIDGGAVFDGVLWLDGPSSTTTPQLWAVQQPLLLSEMGIELGVPVSPLEQ